jgi:hypothetical protein
MRENIIIIDYLEKVHKADRKEDFQKLLSIQIKLAKLEKENRTLKEMINKANKNNYYFSLEVAEIESKSMKCKSDMLVLREELNTLKQENRQLIDDLLNEINI